MSNKFLSRGKREDTGKWVTGYYVELPEDQHGKNFCIIIGLDGQYNRIIPETAGRCVGITDKNNVLIFEGDIIKTKKYGKIVEHSNVNDYDIFVVKYEPAVFRLDNHNRGFNLVGEGTDYEVIGNIHDNSELIGGTE